MNNLVWLIRAYRWSRNPPRARAVKMVLAVVALAIVIALLQHFGLWPEWATIERQRGIRLQRP